ncbi:MAG: cytochrome c [Gammaproteobacteria bacterium]
MDKLISTLGLALLLGSVALPGAAEERPRPGEESWQLFCEGCHRPDGEGPGAVMLQRRYGDERMAIKGNKTLVPEYIRAVVRNGLLEMAPLRPTDITDEELDLLIEFLHAD